MASLEGQQENYSNNPAVENIPKRPESREGSAERKVSKDREEKLKYARDRQNEERQRKIEELRAQAEAAQKYREQKEEERRRRIEEIRVRDTEKRHQVEERKKAIIEAEKERREYILKKNQERESRIETKKRDRNSIAFAFGSSTPRLLDVPADYGLVSPSTYWSQRRSTSISNVAGTSLSRRSSERELADSGAKKRASSSTDRQDDHRRKSSSMYEVFNWGFSNDEPPKRYSLSIAGSEINIDGPMPPVSRNNAQKMNSTTTTTATTTAHRLNNNNNYSYRKEDIVDTSSQNMMFRSVYRRKTDLMPTIPSPRDGHYGSRSSLSTTPRTPGRAYSMNRLDQLAQPIRRNGEHVRAILERERRDRELEMLDETASLGGGTPGGRRGVNPRGKRAGSAGASGSSTAVGAISRSMTHLAAGGHHQLQRERGKYSLGGGISSSFRPLSSGQRDSSKSMTHISNSWSLYGTPNNNHHHNNTNNNQPQRQSNLGLQTAATKKYLQTSFASSLNNASYATGTANASRRAQQQYATSSTNPHYYRYHDLDPNSLLLMNSPSLLVNAGSRSGNVTPGGHGHLSGSRPGSAMSTSTTLSTTAGLVPRRPATAPRKPRPNSIAGTGMSLEEINKLKRENKPPVKTSTTAASPSTSTAQTTPKRTPNLMSTSMIVTSSSARSNSAEKKTPSKREPVLPKASSASKAQSSRTSSVERIGRQPKESINKHPPSVMSTSMIVTSSNSSTTTTTTNASAPTPKANGVVKAQEELPVEVPMEAPAVIAPVPTVSKAEKEALNTVKTEQQQGQVQQELVQLEVDKQPEPIAHEQELIETVLMPTEPTPTIAVAADEEKMDEGNEKPIQETPRKAVRELTPPTIGGGNGIDGNNDLMTASMMAKKITTEEEAKAALAERRRLAREEAERQAELERQRQEAERLAELKAQEEEAERQRLFEEESTRLAEEQRRGEEERLRKAIEEAQQREKEVQRMREDEERQRIERDEAEKKAKEDAEKQRVEVAERLKREEKEREERRKRVEAIMLRTRKGGPATASAATPTKESNDTKASAASSKESDSNSSSSNSASGSPSSNSTDAAAPTVAVGTVEPLEPANSEDMYEQSVLDKENSLISSFSNMIIDENAKNFHQFEVSNGKLHVESTTTATTVPAAAVANGNGHIGNVNNKNDINLLQDAVTPAVTQLIDLSIDSQDIHINNNNNNNNNNSLLTSTASTTNTLVTADSHENKDISLL